MQHPGRLALVTGAASGIGRVTALRLMREGARVVLVDLAPAVQDLADQARSQGKPAWARTLDVSDAQAVQACVEEVQANCGAIDLLVNGAGIVDHVAPLGKMKPARWEREIAVNLGGPFNLIRLIAPQMAQRGWGRIVNISSGAARGGLALQAGYSASKSGLLGLTRNVTLEFARFGVTCNAILPGLIETEKVLAMPATIRDRGMEATPAGRFGTTEEVAALISFLCSAEAGYINGAEIDISGGSHLSSISLAIERHPTAASLSSTISPPTR